MPRFTPLSEMDDFNLSLLVDRWGLDAVLEALAVKMEDSRRNFPNDRDYQAQLTHTVAALDACQERVKKNYREAREEDQLVSERREY